MDQLTIHPTAVVCRGAVLKGNVTIGPGTVVHPTATIVAEGDTAIDIGRDNMIEEQTVLRTSAENGSGTMMIIGDNNVFEIGAGAFAGTTPAAVVALVHLHDSTTTMLSTAHSELEDHTIVYGPRNETRVDPVHIQPETFKEELKLLQESLGKYHPMIQP
ncbi:hypothetical protein PTSG_08961 [Salpingoeca rosetta]|uniref:Dynactin subunit 6 n=1 Tax=Salpingoeca rosetta (strain ATCC 50818 / BSB-021) TaxID=946362 RepID=F2ULT4_SALR5|nr:uncharacterized protein PTSG_08961 [Salpingoeca rosetta]EGD78083.1 hypothetical protein PTSG_08961 [Salpingoeca rosetta]|eukprot:XP_004989759.1 hypothetical protein PTSG_08961 [Salpingoeca rosetta]